MTESFAAAAPHVVAATTYYSNPFGWVVWLVVFVFMIYDVFKSNATTGAKVGWIIFTFFCSIIALIVWLVWGRKRAYAAQM